MIKEIEKRDGRRVPFDIKRIKFAIMMACVDVFRSSRGIMDAALERKIDGVVESVGKTLEGYEQDDGAISVEDVQDVVVEALKNGSHDDNLRAVGEAYERYREERTRARSNKSSIMKMLGETAFGGSEDVDARRENANINADAPMGRMYKGGSNAFKEYFLDNAMSKHFAELHRKGILHQHDLDYFSSSVNCVVENTHLVLKVGGEIKTVCADYFSPYGVGVTWFEDGAIQILSKDTFVPLYNVSIRDEKGSYLRIATKNRTLNVTDNHIVPVIRNGELCETKASHIQKGDELVSVDGVRGNTNTLDLFAVLGNQKGYVLSSSSSKTVRYALKKMGMLPFLVSMRELSRKSEDGAKCPYYGRITTVEYSAIRPFVRDVVDEASLRVLKKGGHCSIPAIISLNEDFGFITGLIYSEGCSFPTGVCVTNKDEGLLERWKDACVRVFGTECSFTISKNKNDCSILNLHGTIFKKVICDGIVGTHEGSSRYFLSHGDGYNKEFFVGYLDGLFCGDGSVYKDGNSNISTCSPDAANNIQYMCGIYGFECKVIHLKTTGTSGVVGGIPFTRNHDTYSVRFGVRSTSYLAQTLKSEKFALSNGSEGRDSHCIVDTIERVPYNGLVFDFETGDHHFNANGVWVHNCVQIPLSKLFHGGFFTGHGSLREPNSIATAAAQAAIIIQSSQNDCFGGQSCPSFEYDLAPFVKKTFLSHLFEILDDKDIVVLDGAKAQLLDYARTHSVLDPAANRVIRGAFSDERTYVIENVIVKARKRTEKTTAQAMEGFIHNLNTMASRAGAQVPFSSINYGTGTEPEERMIIDKVLDAVWNGLGNGETAIFPISIFRVKDGINGLPGDPNYDLYEKACRVSAKRLFPNFEFLDAPFNLQYFKPGDHNSFVATMGMTTENGVVSVTMDGEDEVSMRFSDFWQTITSRDDVTVVQFDDITEYVDLTGKNITIADQMSGQWVECKKVMRCLNPKANWLTVSTAHGNSVTVTSDHPLAVKVAGVPTPLRITAMDLVPGEFLYAVKPISVDPNGYVDHWDSIAQITPLDGSLTNEWYGYDVETSSDKFNLSGIVSHNCRTRVIGNTYDPTQEVTEGRGNVSFSSINLPFLALQAEGDYAQFLKLLDEVVTDGFDQLKERFEAQCKLHVYELPFLMGEGVYLGSEKLAPTDTIEDVLKHGTLSLGFVGLAECLKVLTGHHHGENESAWFTGYEIIKYMRERCDMQSAKDTLNFSLIGSPAEGIAGKMLRLTRKQFGMVPGVTDRDYFTNSFHVPVWFPITVKDKIDKEAPFHALCNAGHISYIEFDGDPNMNVEAFMDIVQYAKKMGIGYFSINSAVDYDPVCGYVGIIGDTCPRCGRKAFEPVTPEQYTDLRSKFRPNTKTIYED